MAILQVNFRIDTAANWTTNNPTLLAGEPGYESDTGYLKIGDGTTNWVGLAYWGSLGGDLTLDGDLTISNADPRILLEETGATANNTKWDILLDAEQLQFRALADDELTHSDWLTVDRTANTIDAINLNATTVTVATNLAISGSAVESGPNDNTAFAFHRQGAIGRLDLAGGSDGKSGGNIQLLGETHPTAAGVVRIRSSLNTFFEWDESAGTLTLSAGTGAKTQVAQFATHLLTLGSGTNDMLVARGVSTSATIISGGTAGSSGAAVAMYGPTHATLPGDMELKSAGNTFLNWDESAGTLEIFTGTGAKTSAALYTDTAVTSRRDFYISATIPRLFYDETDAPVDSKRWYNVLENQILYHRIINDASSLTNTYMQVTRSGMDISSIELKTGTTPGTVALTIDASQNATFAQDVKIGAAATDANYSLDVADGNYTALFGADDGLKTRTNATTKRCRLSLFHYTNTEEAVALIVANSTATINQLAIGGGSSLTNAATELNFYVAANNTTLSGTMHMRLVPDQLGFGDSSGTAQFGLNRRSNSAHMAISGGNSSGSGAVAFMYGGAHATRAGDFEINADTNRWLLWDESAGSLTLSSGTGAKTAAVTINNGGNVAFKASTASATSIQIPHGTAPTAPVDGDIWTTTGGVFARVNGVTNQLDAAGGGGIGGSITDNQVAVGAATADEIEGSSTFTYNGTTLSLSNDTNSTAEMITASNPNAGTAARAQITAAAGGSISLGATGQSFTTAGGYNQDGGYLVAETTLSGGLSVMAANVNAGVRVYAGGTAAGNLIATFAASGAGLQLLAPTTSRASLRLPHGTAPTTPTNGDAWTTTAGIFVRVNGSTVGPLIASTFPSGTLMLFQQTSAPTGWTKQTTHNDKALRVVSGTAGSAGTVAFSTVFGKTATDAHTLTTAQMPVHNHSLNLTDWWGNSSTTNSGWGADQTSSGTTNRGVTNAGSGSSHSHNMDIRVQYVDVIIASKD